MRLDHQMEVAEGRKGTYSLKVAYNGAPFSGFARQPGQRTVQGELEHALSLIFRSCVEITCAGRTDSGVHALRQHVSFDIDPSLMEIRGARSFLRSMNALTDDAIAVSDLQEREPGFSARFSAKSREYRYFLYPSPAPSVFMDGFSWHVGSDMDADAMRGASACLLGEHDFKSFCMAASAKGRNTVRRIDEIDIFRESVLGGEMLVIKVVGNAFLHSMVRAIVGTLVLVGKGKRPADWVKDVLAACDRKAAGENAPAHGLVLWDVAY